MGGDNIDVLFEWTGLQCYTNNDEWFDSGLSQLYPLT